MDSLEGKVVVVTGAASGIGLALSHAFAADGARVVMADVDAARLGAAAATVDGDVLSITADVASADSVDALAARVHAEFAGVHVLCNNAGVQRAGRVWSVPPEDFEWLLRVNLLGAFHGIRAFVPAMIDRGEPSHIVNTASIGGVLGFPRIGAYAATKFAVVGLSESLLHDLNERGAPIGVSVLCPGATATGLAANSAALRGTDQPRAGESQGVDPTQIASAVIDAVKRNRFWILTHPGYNRTLERRTAWMLGAAEPPSAPGFFL